MGQERDSEVPRSISAAKLFGNDMWLLDPWLQGLEYPLCRCHETLPFYTHENVALPQAFPDDMRRRGVYIYIKNLQFLDLTFKMSELSRARTLPFFEAIISTGSSFAATSPRFQTFENSEACDCRDSKSMSHVEDGVGCPALSLRVVLLLSTGTTLWSC